MRSKNEFSAFGSVDGAAETKKNSAISEEQDVPTIIGGKARRDPAAGPEPLLGMRGRAYSHIALKEGEEANIYAEAMSARYKMDPRTRKIVILIIILVVLTLFTLVAPSSFCSYSGGSTLLSPAQLVDQITVNFHTLANAFGGGSDASLVSSAFCLRIMIILSGVALATAGCVYQGSTGNPMAAPSTLGVMMGGSLGGMIYIVTYTAPEAIAKLTEGPSTYEMNMEAWNSLTFGEQVMQNYGEAIYSLIGCFIAVAIVLIVAYVSGRGKVSKVGLIITGQVIVMLGQSASQFLRFWAEQNCSSEVVEALSERNSGAFYGAYDWSTLLMAGLPILIGFIIIFCLRGKLNLLAFNDDEARSMGISTMRLRNTMVIVVTIMTAVVISFCGAVGFVGFIVPHLARKFIGPDFRKLIPASALLGAIFVMAAWWLVGAFTAYQSRLGFYTTILGTIVFIIAFIRQRKEGNADWI